MAPGKLLSDVKTEEAEQFQLVETWTPGNRTKAIGTGPPGRDLAVVPAPSYPEVAVELPDHAAAAKNDCAARGTQISEQTFIVCILSLLHALKQIGLMKVPSG